MHHRWIHRASLRPASRIALWAFLAALAARAADEDSSNPPGKAPADARTELLRKFDANRDGRLDPSERERMRSAARESKATAKSMFQIPPEFLARYDADHDGEMTGPEWKVAWEAETKVLRETYDTSKDGKLDAAETARMLEAVKTGKLTGIPAFFASRMAEDPASGGAAEPAYLVRQRELLVFDADSDGIASPAELQKIREARSASAPKPPAAAPQR